MCGLNLVLPACASQSAARSVLLAWISDMAPQVGAKRTSSQMFSVHTSNANAVVVERKLARLVVGRGASRRPRSDLAWDMESQEVASMARWKTLALMRSSMGHVVIRFSMALALQVPAQVLLLIWTLLQSKSETLFRFDSTAGPAGDHLYPRSRLDALTECRFSLAAWLVVLLVPSNAQPHFTI